MNYSQDLEIQQKGKELIPEYIYLVLEILKRNILSINIRPGSFVYYKPLDLERSFKFSGERKGKEISGIISITFKRNDLVLIDYLDLYIEGSAERVKVKFDEYLNIISCEVAVLNEDNNDMRFLNLENAQNDFVKINYYDSDATDLAKANTPESNIEGVFSEKAYTLNGLLPDRETAVCCESQEELSNIISSFWENAELLEKIYRGELKLIKDNKDRKDVEN